MKTNEIVFKYIKNYIEVYGYSPSVREIAKGVALKSSSTVHGHLVSLKERNLITFEENKSRTIRVI